MFKSFRRLTPIISLMAIATFALAACGGVGASSGSGQPVDVQVTLTDFKIDSSLTTFSTGVPYHFVVVNKGAVNHQFVIMPPVSNPTTQQIDSMKLAGIAGDGIAPGATATVDYTFTKPAPAGTLEFACHLPGHYDAGMHTPIVVQ
jgi:uncharacterized cupredoxin-like copper-binding protein